MDELSSALDAAVLLRILELKLRGGPSEEDYQSLSNIGQLLGEQGDDLLFKSKRKGGSAKVFNEVARGIAILAFAPGGVTIFGNHYEGRVNRE